MSTDTPQAPPPVFGSEIEDRWGRTAHIYPNPLGDVVLWIEGMGFLVLPPAALNELLEALILHKVRAQEIGGKRGTDQS